MKSVKGTKTEMNLMSAFAGESQARNRYTFFASKAKNEGFVQIADIFEETANQEKEHAKKFFNFLEGGEIAANGTFPAGMVKSTLENLKAAAAGEKHEWTELYPAFAKIAKDEGLDAVAKLFTEISIAERQHEKRYSDLARNVETGRVFKKDAPVTWRCRNCGYIHTAAEALAVCPACARPQAHFEVLGENW